SRESEEPPKAEQIEGQFDTRMATPEELEAQEHTLRVEHNKRTGGGAVREGELQAAREEHNRRTAGDRTFLGGR
ncbi:MAG TPA: hypothetical protein VM715_03160, partial [Candidatus Acidoferrum sp.]|nr:hypothetical protein [Candidatus Acidoferrum sp.]